MADAAVEAHIQGYPTTGLQANARLIKYSESYTRHNSCLDVLFSACNIVTVLARDVRVFRAC